MSTSDSALHKGLAKMITAHEQVGWEESMDTGMEARYLLKRFVVRLGNVAALHF